MLTKLITKKEVKQNAVTIIYGKYITRRETRLGSRVDMMRGLWIQLP